MIPLPAPLHYAGQPVTRVRVHEKCSEWAHRAFDELHARELWYLLDPYAGSYAFRLSKGGASLSAHAYAAAFDFDPEGNPLGAPMHMTRFAKDPRGMVAVEVLESWGWYWGGRWESRPDGMHFSWVRGGL